MKALFAAFAFVLLASCFATPALAADTASAPHFAVRVVDGFPERCPVGETMAGTIVVDADKAGAGVRKLVVVVETRVETAFGDVVLSKQSYRMDPGSTANFPVEVTVPADTPAGDYTFAFDVHIGADTATVDQTVTVY